MLLAAAAAGAGAVWQEQFAHGKAALDRGDAETAAREFSAVLSGQPELLPARVNLGLAYHLMGDTPRAVETLELVRRQSHDLGGANLVLGMDALALGKSAQAIPPLEDAAHDLHDAKARKMLCGAYAAVERFPMAVGCLATHTTNGSTGALL